MIVIFSFQKDIMEDCVFCSQPLANGQPTVVIRQKGSSGIQKATEIRGDCLEVPPGQTVHQQCRKDYCNPNTIISYKRKSGSAVNPDNGQKRLRSRSQKFVFKESCLFCGQQDIYSGRKRGHTVIPVLTSDFDCSIRKICLARNDDWGMEVLSRLEYARDLHAANAVYHKQCSVNFRTNKQVPRQFDEDNESKVMRKKRRQGRPSDEEKSEAFLNVIKYLEEHDDEQITLSDLVSKMNEYLKENGSNEKKCEPYSVKHMKRKLEEHFGDKILITEVNGLPNVVTFKATASSILSVFFNSSETDDCDKNLRLVKTVAQFLKSDIKGIKTSKDTYPSFSDLSSVHHNLAYIPESLKLLLQELFVGEDADLKVASIGQAIVQAVRPRALIAPLQIGLAVQMHHHFASRFLVDTLNSHGFCSSYSEVQRFERSAAASQGTDISGYSDGQFIQYVADNVDHNIRTIDGHNTFHGMGIIAAITPGIKSRTPVARISVTSEDVAATGRIDIHAWMGDSCRLQSMVYESFENFVNLPRLPNIDLLWKVSWLLRPRRPCWSGLMQLICKGDHPGQSSITFLPMIDMDPTNMTCIYSTLKFVCKQAKQYDVTPIITFDQPLWWKAMSIIENEPLDSDLHDVVLRLGGFHIEMSFLGCMGYLMSGSGLEELLEVLYAKNAVLHMMHGKAVARALRGHFLVDTALNSLLMSNMFSIPLTETHDAERGDYARHAMTSEVEMHVDDYDEQVEENDETNLVQEEDECEECTEKRNGLQEVVMLLEKLMNNDITVGEIQDADVLIQLEVQLRQRKEELKKYRTARLWIQYMDMVNIIQRFIRAERTGNWQLHLQTLGEMMPYLAASGHNLYAKSIYLYLQKMHRLEQEHPATFRQFESGMHVIRRSDRLWAGLSTDLVIEQVLMRSMKTSGGLTRGKGMTELQRVTWLLSMPKCSEINNAMQELTGVSHFTSEQHKDTTETRIDRDNSDIQKLVGYLRNRNPFTGDLTLRNIATGVTAVSVVNVDNAYDVGMKILKKMHGKRVTQFIFRRNDQAVTLASKYAVNIKGEVVQVPAELLFQRYVVAARNIEEIGNIFKYELCTHPPALFDKFGMRMSRKSALADAMWTKLNDCETARKTDTTQFVLDGGSLLQRLPWPPTESYSNIANIYVKYVQAKYGSFSTLIVFDGYKDGPTTKDITHQRRSKGHIEHTITFTNDMICKTKKDKFLTNKANKQQMIDLIGDRLEAAGCQVVKSDGDADLIIVQKTLESARLQDTVVIGEDTDLLVLLCYHSSFEGHNIYFRSEKRQDAKCSTKVWNIKSLKRELGIDNCKHILFTHAILGCDTTSGVFGIGKGTALKLMNTNEHFRHQALVFLKQNSSKTDIEAAGEAALVALYGGGPTNSINSLRFEKFCQKVATNTTFVHPQTLPPTASAAKYHSYRVYHQVQEWTGRTGLNPLDWGWHLDNEKLVPTEMDLPPAPPSLQNVIRCSCKSDCSSARCSCRRHGLECTLACKECKGISCVNVPQPDLSSPYEVV